ncbi:LptF/LptG family permease, partial [candidate division WOR-3 bacterium]|nr:LptF/LptG family permease [candidate division WOR-3 bacterium]
MWRFPRYVLRQYLVPLVLAWAVLTGVFLMDRLFLLVDLIVRKGLALQHVLEILLYTLPFVMAMSVPLASLAGAMMTFGRLAQDNEILALRSAGVRLFSVFVPMLWFTALLAGVMVY